MAQASARVPAGNTVSVKRWLTHLRDQGLATDRKYLFVIDGAKALRSAIEEVFGSDQPVQRCRNHKVRNVLDELPQEQHGQLLAFIPTRLMGVTSNIMSLGGIAIAV